MACPFCALGCKGGLPLPSEISRNWRIRQLKVHPDHEGGSKEATIFLNQTKDYAMECLSKHFNAKAIAINCSLHSTPQCGYNSMPAPAQFPPSTASASADKYFPPSLPPSKPSVHHPPAPDPDPWESYGSGDKQYFRLHSAFPTYQPQQQSQQAPTDSDKAQPPPATPPQIPPPSSKPRGWYKQSFQCIWCKTVMEIEGHGSWPFVKAQQEGWSKAAKRSREDSASCKSCATSYYGYTTTTNHDSPPSPTIASPQPTSIFAWQTN